MHQPIRVLAMVLALAVVVVACGNADPTGSTPAATATPLPTEQASPTPSPTPTPVPTPEPTLPLLDTTAFPDGWTLVASDRRIAGVGEVKVLSTIGAEYAVAVACTGESPMTVRIRANGGDLDKAGVDLAPIDVPCPATDPSAAPLGFTFGAGDYHGVSLSIDTEAADGTEYIVLIASHG